MVVEAVNKTSADSSEEKIDYTPVTLVFYFSRIVAVPGSEDGTERTKK